ncbi:MAG TPA: helix-turn-helix domain-containing protein [Streptosporangiaceae bacterium]|nr:helix-turn-helix domain-containing protein [Streptosporangiaceae bacterium]
MARPVTLHVALTAGQRADLRQRLRQRTLSPRLRRRLECIRLAGQGWPVPRVAAHLSLDQATIRRTIHRLAGGGLDGLADRPRSGRPPKLDSRDLDAAEELLARAAGRNEIWTLAQPGRWLARTRGTTISPGRLSALLRQRGCNWTRPARRPGGSSGAAR